MTQKQNNNPFLNVSTAFTDKFFELDRIMWKWSPYLTYEESGKILDQMEVYAKSKFEGNWTTSDCYQFLTDMLGAERIQLITMLEVADYKDFVNKHNKEKSNE